MNFWRPSWRHIWRPVWRPPPHYAAAAPKTIQQISGISGVPSKFQVSRLEIADCSVEHTHTHTNKVHFELKGKSHYVRQQHIAIFFNSMIMYKKIYFINMLELYPSRMLLKYLRWEKCFVDFTKNFIGTHLNIKFCWDDKYFVMWVKHLLS